MNGASSSIMIEYYNYCYLNYATSFVYCVIRFVLTFFIILRLSVTGQEAINAGNA